MKHAYGKPVKKKKKKKAKAKVKKKSKYQYFDTFSNKVKISINTSFRTQNTLNNLFFYMKQAK